MRLIARAIRTLVVLAILVVFALGWAITRVPDPVTRRAPDGTQVFEPKDDDMTIGETMVVNPGSELDTLVSAFAADVYPDYYRVIGVATSVREDAPDGIVYGELDALGRATGAAGWISGAMRAEARAKDRDDAPEMADPAGWPDENPEVEIVGAKGRRDYHGYLWNRSHFIAFSLGGDMKAHNLVAGTRTENVGDNTAEHPGGMAYTETLARDWLDANPTGRLWYAVTPVYVGDERIPRAVAIDIQTEDKAIDQKVLVYNQANGFTIDFATGTATPAEITYR